MIQGHVSSISSISDLCCKFFIWMFQSGSWFCTCCNGYIRMFQVFHLFQTYVANVSSECFKVDRGVARRRWLEDSGRLLCAGAQPWVNPRGFPMRARSCDGRRRWRWAGCGCRAWDEMRGGGAVSRHDILRTFGRWPFRRSFDEGEGSRCVYRVGFLLSTEWLILQRDIQRRRIVVVSSVEVRIGLHNSGSRTLVKHYRS